MSLESNILSVLLVISAVPFGFLAKRLTNHEKNIYKSRQYFPVFLWGLAILAAVFWTLDLVVALTLTWLFVVVFIWNR